MILQPSLVQTQDFCKETVINYLYWLPRQIMHLLAFRFNLSVSELLLSVTQIMHFVRSLKERSVFDIKTPRERFKNIRNIWSPIAHGTLMSNMLMHLEQAYIVISPFRLFSLKRVYVYILSSDICRYTKLQVFCSRALKRIEE